MCIRNRISGSFFPLDLKSWWKSNQMTPFFFLKEVLGEKIIIWVKHGNGFSQIIMFSLYKNNHKFHLMLIGIVRWFSLAHPEENAVPKTGVLPTKVVVSSLA